MAGPLAGFKLLDLTQMLAGPFGTMLLADLGMEVIKVEPLGGDMSRYMGPFMPDDQNHYFGAYFGSINRNKHSIAIDLKHPKGKEVLRRLAREADALMENFRVGVMDRLGLSYESLAAENPRLVYGAVRGFGDPRTGESPYASWPALDVVAQAMGGLMGITGPAPDQPTKAGPGVGDIYPATLCALGVVAAMLEAQRTGQGRFVDVAMVDGILALCERLVYLYSYAGKVSRPEGNGHPLLCPFDIFKTKDGHVAIAAPGDDHFRFLAQAMGQPALAQDERYADNMARVANAPLVRATVGAWTAAHTNAEVTAALGGHVPCGVVRQADDIFADPHEQARQMLLALPHPGSQQQGVFAGPPIKFTGESREPARPAPILGEHSHAVLAQAGYGQEEIQSLIQDGIVAAITSDVP